MKTLVFLVANVVALAAHAQAADPQPSPPAIDVKGAVQVAVPISAKGPSLERAWITAQAKPADGFTVVMRADLAVPKLLEAYGIVRPPGTSLVLRVGQFPPRSLMMTPPPPDERLIGGPGAAALISARDLGAEIGVEGKKASGTVAVITGVGVNKPDDNAGKDLLVSGTCGPFGPLSAQATVQTGPQPQGWRTRSVAQAGLDLKPVTVDTVVSHQRFNGDSIVASLMFAWRAETHIDLAAGWDGLWLAGVPPSHHARLQATYLAFDDRLRVGLMAAYDTATDAITGLGRLQLGF